MSFRWRLSVLIVVVLFDQTENCDRQNTLVPVGKISVLILRISRTLVERERDYALTQVADYGLLIARLMASCQKHNILWLWELSILANSAMEQMMIRETDLKQVKSKLYAKATAAVEARILEYLKESDDDHIEYAHLFKLEWLIHLHWTVVRKMTDKVRNLMDSQNLIVDGTAADYYKPGNLFMNNAGGDPYKIESIQATDVAIDWGFTSRKLTESYRQAVETFSNCWTLQSYRELKNYRDSFVLAAKASIYGYVRVHVALFQSYIGSFRMTKMKAKKASNVSLRKMKTSYIRRVTRRNSKTNFKESSTIWLCWIKPGHSLRTIISALDLGRDTGLNDLCAFFDSSVGDLTPDLVNHAAAYLDSLIRAVRAESDNQITENTKTLVELTEKVLSTNVLKEKIITNDSKMLSFIDNLQNGIFRHVRFRQINLFFDCVFRTNAIKFIFHSDVLENVHNISNRRKSNAIDDKI